MPHRTICVRVAEVLEGGGKQEFYRDLDESLDLSRRAANICIRKYFEIDHELMTGGKCPEKLSAYAEISKLFPKRTILASNIDRTVSIRYKQDRWRISRGLQSVPVVRSHPWPLLHNKSKKTFRLEWKEEYLVATLKLKSNEWKVRIAGGSNFRDQVRGLKGAITNDTIGDSKIWVDRKHRAILGICCDVPASAARQRTGALHVSTSRDSLLLAAKERDDTPFVVNGDQARRWHAERNRKYQRLRQDRKQDKGLRKQANETLARDGAKYARRLRTFCHESTSIVLRFAERRNVAEIVFDGTIKSFLPQFPWHQLSSMLKYKCEDAGIVFRDITQAVAQPNLDKPHVYFRYSASTKRVKIGRTINGKQRLKAAATDSPDDEQLILAIENQPKDKLSDCEKRRHAQFAAYRLHGEWFEGEPVISWLREAGWLGNAGNRSQIAQVLDVEQVTSSAGPLRAHGEDLNRHRNEQVLAERDVRGRDHSTYGDAPAAAD